MILAAVPSVGQVLLAVPISLLAGIVSFISPCVLPLVPGYLGYVSGLDPTGRNGTGKVLGTRRVVLGAALFVLGFSVVFVTSGYLLGAAGFFLVQWRSVLTQVSGAIVILVGIVFIGGFGPLQRMIKPSWQPRAGLGGAPLLGGLFAIGWTPCLGPTLTAINALALQAGSANQGAFLAFVYSMGLGLPFIVAAFGLGWSTRSFAFLTRHVRVLNIFGGAMLILIGVLMVTGVWVSVMTQLQLLYANYVTPI